MQFHWQSGCEGHVGEGTTSGRRQETAVVHGRHQCWYIERTPRPHINWCHLSNTTVQTDGRHSWWSPCRWVGLRPTKSSESLTLFARYTATGLDQLPAWYLRLGAPVFYNFYIFVKSFYSSVSESDWLTVDALRQVLNLRDGFNFLGFFSDDSTLLHSELDSLILYLASSRTL